MKLDLSCPIELRGYTLTAESGRIDAELRLYNLSRRRIDSFEAVVQWRTAQSRRLAYPFTAARLRAGGEAFFTYALRNDRLPEAISLELIFTSVRFENGDDWRSGNGPYADIEPLPFLSSDERALLRRRFGEDAVCRAQQDEATWRCVCGRVNLGESSACIRCHRLREDVFSKESPPADPTTPAMEVMQTRSLRRHAQRLRRTFTVAVAVLALAATLALLGPAKSPNPTSASVASFLANP